MQSPRKALHRDLVKRLGRQTVPGEGNLIVRVENGKEDWSFGVGRA